MKFELVEPAEPTAVEPTAPVPADGLPTDVHVVGEVADGDAREPGSAADPIDALTAVTGRLTAEAAVEAERIDAVLLELNETVRGAWRMAAAGPQARPPRSFRPDRFGVGRGEHGGHRT